MKFNFKPLSSFFKSADNADDTKKQKESKSKAKSASEDDDDILDNDEDNDEDEDDEDEDDGKSASDGKKGKSNMISITAEEYKSFVQAQVELQQFGSTAEDRKAFLADATKLHAWYQAAKEIGANADADADASKGKQKKVSSITAEAKKIAEKANK